ncbi:MAG TPA: FAD-dependent oxidoreductase [Candidatus Deferrimicrobium sp.]|nr:FAD-dependent oxidoreductase [Candidatus Deferrimicrobium sp.]
MKKIAIVGGGMTGLSLAYYLALDGKPVTVFEKEKNAGGLAAAFALNNSFIDKYYRHIFPSHNELIHTIQNLGLQDHLIFKKAAMAYFAHGEIHPLNSIMDLLRFKPLTLTDRLRVGLSASTFLFKNNWETFDNISAETYLKQKCGTRGFETFWNPLLKNKFGDFSAGVSATWLWDRLMSRSRSRLGKSSESLGYLMGSFQVLVDRMIEEIEKHDGRVLTGCPISSIEMTGEEDGSFIFNGDPGYKYHQCIVTLPVPQFIQVASCLPEDYRRRLEPIDYAHSICMVLRLKEPLSPFYWINIGDASFPFAVVVEHTNWINNDNYNGEHIVYLSQYITSMEDDAWKAPDHVLLETYCPFLEKLCKNFHESQVIGCHVSHDPYTQPIFKTGYSRLLPPFATPVKDLFLVNTSQFYPLSRCMNTSFKLAKNFISSWPGIGNSA